MIKHVVNDNGGTAAASDFTLDSGGDDDSPDDFAGAETPGHRGDPRRWRLRRHRDAARPATRPATRPTARARSRSVETKTCTVTNTTMPAKLTVIKHVVNDNGGTAVGVRLHARLGRHRRHAGRLRRRGGSGHRGHPRRRRLQCHRDVARPATRPATRPTARARSQSARRRPARSPTTTMPPKLIVIKHVINDNGGTASARDFTLDSGGTNDSPDDFAGAEAPGTDGHASTPAPTTSPRPARPATRPATRPTARARSPLGETKTCTVTNNDIATKLTVIKHVINDNGGTAVASDFTLDSGGTNDSPDDFAGAEAPGTDGHPRRRRLQRHRDRPGRLHGQLLGRLLRHDRNRRDEDLHGHQQRPSGQADRDQARDQRQRRHRRGVRLHA